MWVPAKPNGVNNIGPAEEELEEELEEEREEPQEDDEEDEIHWTGF